MALWPFTPQETFTEGLTHDVRIAPIGPRAENVGRMVDDLTRTFHTRYTLVASSDVGSMAAFFQARRGAFEAFDFLNPNDARVYLVRFDGGLTLEMFTPGFFRTGGDLAFTVVDS